VKPFDEFLIRLGFIEAFCTVHVRTENKNTGLEEFGLKVSWPVGSSAGHSSSRTTGFVSVSL
jgi:hypothetical protein